MTLILIAQVIDLSTGNNITRFRTITNKMTADLFSLLYFQNDIIPLSATRHKKYPIYDLKTHLIGEEKLNVTAVVDFQKTVSSRR